MPDVNGGEVAIEIAAGLAEDLNGRLVLVTVQDSPVDVRDAAEYLKRLTQPAATGPFTLAHHSGHVTNTTVDALSTVAWSTYAPRLIGGKPRQRLPDFIYDGGDDSHLNGQRCEIVRTDADDRCYVVFACGCASDVPREWLRATARPSSGRALSRA